MPSFMNLTETVRGKRRYAPTCVVGKKGPTYPDSARYCWRRSRSRNSAPWGSESLKQVTKAHAGDVEDPRFTQHTRLGDPAGGQSARAVLYPGWEVGDQRRVGHRQRAIVTRWFRWAACQ